MGTAETSERARVLMHNAIREQALSLAARPQPWWHPTTTAINMAAADELHRLADAYGEPKGVRPPVSTDDL